MNFQAFTFTSFVASLQAQSAQLLEHAKQERDSALDDKGDAEDDMQDLEREKAVSLFFSRLSRQCFHQNVVFLSVSFVGSGISE